MCTAITYKTKDHYFGRTLDYHFSYNETIVVVPRNYPFSYRQIQAPKEHYAMIGTALVLENYPLFFDATNEKGLSMAGLNFVGNAHYQPCIDGKDNIAQFELIPWVLGQCETVEEARELLERINITDEQFCQKFPVAQLHWMISDRAESITVESVKDGLKIYDNPVGVLTNNPPFEMQMFSLNNYMGLSAQTPENHFAPELKLETYGCGMGAIGLPGDMSSMSRFVRVAFAKMNAVSGDSESESISQFYHIMGTVEQPRGMAQVDEDTYEISWYSSCCNTDKGIYYYKTYHNSQITGVDMHKEDLNGIELVVYPMIQGQQIKMQN